MKKGSTLFLKVVIVLIGAGVLALCIFLVPRFAEFIGALYPRRDYLSALVYVNMYGAAIPFYIALFLSFRLLTYIDRSDAFSELSVRALKGIKSCAVVISILYAIGLPLFYLIAAKVDPPGVTGICLIIIGASLVIAVFAAVLEKLLEEAIRIKSENELTV